MPSSEGRKNTLPPDVDAISSRSVARCRVCTCCRLRCYPVHLENCFNLLREIRVIFAWTRIPHKPLDSLRLLWTLRLCWCRSDCAGLSQTAQDSLRLCWTLSDCTGLSQPALDSLRLRRTLSDCAGLAQTALDSLRLRWTRSDCAGLSQTALDSLRLCWTLSDCAGLAQTAMDSLRLRRTLRDCTGLSHTALDSLRLRWTRPDCAGLSRDRLTLASSNRIVSDRTLCQTKYCQPSVLKCTVYQTELSVRLGSVRLDSL